METSSFIQAGEIRKSFRLSGRRLDVLKGVSLSVNEGEWAALLGASGSGKTTLLDILGTLSHPDSGTLSIAGRDVLKMSSGELVKFRRETIGFVFQSYHLLPELTVLENVMLPGMFSGRSGRECRNRACELLERTGLAERITHRPNELSGGEQQRAALCRALLDSPKLLLADEPTGNLDSVTGAGILELFRELHANTKMTIVMVTHDSGVAAQADRRIELRDGLTASRGD